ncbi:MAG TPA: citrate synthase [Myxococcaceae bacterium]|nr:citrate synthase [Myxococcaceae bacterium]
MADSVASGLEGVVVADTALSEVDGERGRLVIAGHDVEELGGRRSFEELCAELWASVPGATSDAELSRALGQERVRAFEQLEGLGRVLSAADGMDALRGALGQLPSDGSAWDLSVRLTAAVAVFTAAWWRRREGLATLPPDPGAGHAEDLVSMLRGKATTHRASGLETYLVVVSDHGMNASTFTARVIASTGSDAVSAVVGAIGALKGPLHGGAPGPVLDMLDAIGRPEAAAEWLERELLAGRRIMGMGHRVYRTRDPRAAVLERAVERLEREGHRTPRLELARAVQRAAEDVLRARHPDRPLRANVEFYTAVLLDALGLPREAFSPLFACGRVVGWLAHVDEQRRTGRLIRPESRYVGRRPVPGAG